MTGLQTIRWGELVLDDVEVSTTRTRALLAQVPARGAGGYLQDRGPEPRECRVSLRWTRRSNDDDPLARYRALLAADDGKTRLLVHPIDGAYPAKMSIEEETVTNGRVTASVRFVEDRGDGRHPRTAAPASVATAVTVAQSRAQAAADALTRLGLPADVAQDSAALAASWVVPESLAPADVQTQVERHTEAVADMARECVGDADRLESHLALIELITALRDAAAAVLASSPGLVELTLDAPVTVLALAAALYGGELAADRAAAIVHINGLRHPNVLPAPVTLMVPSA